MAHPTSARSTILAGTRVHLVRMPPDLQLRGHSHDSPHLCFVVDGVFRERCGDRSEVCHPRRLRASPAHDRHDIVFGPKGALCLLVESNDAALPAPRRRMFHDETRLARCALALVEEFQGSSPARLPRMQALTSELIAQAARHDRARAEHEPPQWLAAARARLGTGVPDERSALAAAAGVHPVHLTRAFREHFGATPTRHRARQRVSAALSLLAQGEASLAEVAAACGFADQSHMTRVFKSVLGVTPGRWRRESGGLAEGD